MRLIDADVLLDTIRRDSKKAIDEGDKVGSFWLGYAAGLVIKQPTIQPEPKEGHWENDKHDMPRCSQCGYIPEYNRFIDDYYYSDYCPNCGARMKGADT